MNTTQYARTVGAYSLRRLLVLLITILSASALTAQERPVYVDPFVYYEMVRVEVTSVNEDGSGILRINQNDCGGCTVDVTFTDESVLESPLGDYRGLSKLSSWTDKDVLVIAGKQDGVVLRVKVL